MRRAWRVAVLLALAAGCGGKPAVAPGAAQGGAGAASSADSAGAAWAGGGEMTLAFYNDRDDPGATHPSFVLTSPNFQRSGEGLWEAQNVRATIYEDQSETRIEAGSARYDQNRRTAELSGGVKFDRGTQRCEAEDLIWYNDERVARTERPVRLEEAGRTLQAEKMEFYPAESRIVLHEVRGVIALKSEESK